MTSITPKNGIDDSKRGGQHTEKRMPWNLITVKKILVLSDSARYVRRHTFRCQYGSAVGSQNKSIAFWKKKRCGNRGSSRQIGTVAWHLHASAAGTTPQKTHSLTNHPPRAKYTTQYPKFLHSSWKSPWRCLPHNSDFTPKEGDTFFNAEQHTMDPLRSSRYPKQLCMACLFFGRDKTRPGVRPFSPNTKSNRRISETAKKSARVWTHLKRTNQLSNLKNKRHHSQLADSNSILGSVRSGESRTIYSTWRALSNSDIVR